MFITILFPGSVMAPSAELLRRVLAQKGRRVETRMLPSEDALAGFDLLVRLEKLVLRRENWPPVDVPDLSDDSLGTGRSIVLDLGQGRSGKLPPGAELVLSVTCNGQLGLPGMVAAILAGGHAELAVVTRSDGGDRVWASGLTVTSRPLNAAVSLHELTLRLGDLVAVALRRIEHGEEPVAAEHSVAAASGGLSPFLAFAATSLSRRIRDRLDELVRHPYHWSVRWRRSDPEDLVTTRLGWTDAPYKMLPDDGQRYYADPFLYQHEGRNYLFVEEFPYATGKGILSVSELNSGGGASVPRPVMEGPVHLSYPQVFKQGGEIWMIPETSGARTIELYRAVEFPDRWVKEAVLLSDIDASDATLVFHGGRFWLFAALHPHGSSCRDMLGIFHAPALQGPWVAHKLNPALIDARTARPGGAFFRHEGALMRVAQDGSRGYGSGLTICRVDRLDPDHFTQTVAQTLQPRADWRAAGVHTLNCGFGIEAIDTLAKLRKT